ncbi:MBL fold metallo-hydrolase [Dyella choica]|uniref:MBL fold metallo-hydrolase n=1 Tax=Dyella choica TaxID=1927959 RepID=A0A3S0PIJ3_9GAMM|nr:MBL fold metallo-hydrolase [Dyella choica]RUL69265.1 MBL fold metallo-hydrolase [Dyella choica]
MTTAATMDEQVCLKSDVKIEPLTYRWYAWGHLVSPVQMAMNLAFRQIPMLKSFVANPGVHEAASKNPQLLGGTFLELKQSDVSSVRKLLQETLQAGAPLIEFANDLMQIDRQLLKTESGHSLDHIYAKLPDSLAGAAEVAYDLANRPTLRMLEELIYGSAIHHRHAQELAFTTKKDDQRNFFLNTPRLESPDRMILPMPFADRRVDLIASARTRAASFRDICDALAVPEDRRAAFGDFFTAHSPRRDQPDYTGDGVRVRYFGHACVLLQSKEVSILIDPFVTWDHDDAEGRLTFHDLPDHIDYVFLTHNHQDHFCPEVLLQLRGRIGRILVPRNNTYSIADPSMRLALNSLGFSNVEVMDAMDAIPVPDGEITSLPFYGEHADLSISSKHAMHVKLKGRSFLFVADSDGKDRQLYRRIAERIGQVDTLFVGMECDGAPLTWLYGTYLPQPIHRKDDDSRRLSGSDSDRAWTIVAELGCKTAYVYALGQEPWLKFVAGLQYTAQSKQIIESDKFVQRCRAAGIVSERLHGCRTMHC